MTHPYFIQIIKTAIDYYWAVQSASLWQNKKQRMWLHRTIICQGESSKGAKLRKTWFLRVKRKC